MHDWEQWGVPGGKFIMPVQGTPLKGLKGKYFENSMHTESMEYTCVRKPKLFHNGLINTLFLWYCPF